jgi:hypothetical protein
MLEHGIVLQSKGNRRSLLIQLFKKKIDILLRLSVNGSALHILNTVTVSQIKQKMPFYLTYKVHNLYFKIKR